MILGAFFGYASPMILLALVSWIFIQTLMDAMSVIQFHKRECEKFGYLFAQSLWFILSMLIFCHVIFLCQSVLHYNTTAILFNLCTLIFQVMFYLYCINTFKGTGIIQENLTRKYVADFNDQKLHYWLSHNSHPLLSQPGNKLKDYIRKNANNDIDKYLNNYVESLNIEN